MTDKKIYEIAQMMSDSKSLQYDLHEAASSALSLFQDKYINKIYDTVKAHHTNTLKSPSREVTLLNALKPYITKYSHSQVDKVINIITLLNTMNNMNKDLAAYYNSNASNTSNASDSNVRGFHSMSSSLHPDGVYDVDAVCMTDSANNRIKNAHFTGLLLMMALFNME